METKMIIGDTSKIAVQLEYIIDLLSPSGMFNFIIDEELIPGRGTVTDLYTVITFLKTSLIEGKQRLKVNLITDIGNIPLSNLDFSDGGHESLIYLDLGELANRGQVFYLGFDGEEERLIFSLDNEETYQEKRYPRGTIEQLINSLPEPSNLRIIRKNQMITTTDVVY
jgi:hypothetical protein